MLYLHNILQHDSCSIKTPDSYDAQPIDVNAYAVATIDMIQPPYKTKFSRANRSWAPIFYRRYSHSSSHMDRNTLLLFSENPYHIIELYDADNDFITDSTLSDFEDIYNNEEYDSEEVHSFYGINSKELVRVIQEFNIYHEYIYNYLGNYYRHVVNDFNKLSSLNFRYYGFKQHLLDTKLCEKL